MIRGRYKPRFTLRCCPKHGWFADLKEHNDYLVPSTHYLFSASQNNADIWAHPLWTKAKVHGIENNN